MLILCAFKYLMEVFEDEFVMCASPFPTGKAKFVLYYLTRQVVYVIYSGIVVGLQLYMSF